MNDTLRMLRLGWLLSRIVQGRRVATEQLRRATGPSLFVDMLDGYGMVVDDGRTTLRFKLMKFITHDAWTRHQAVAR